MPINLRDRSQRIVTLDLEGVLIPEIWIAVAERTGIEALQLTTRDEPDYDVLMTHRLDTMATHGLTMSVITEVISTLSPLPGAVEFLDELRSRVQVLILSDTFEQFAAPLMPALGMPTVWCHNLEVVDDRIVDYHLRISDQKARAVRALHDLNFTVAAAGDSYNDRTMLAEADAGYWFCAPANVRTEFPQFAAVDDHPALLAAISDALGV